MSYQNHYNDNLNSDNHVLDDVNQSDGGDNNNNNDNDQSQSLLDHEIGNVTANVTSNVTRSTNIDAFHIPSYSRSKTSTSTNSNSHSNSNNNNHNNNNNGNNSNKSTPFGKFKKRRNASFDVSSTMSRLRETMVSEKADPEYSHSNTHGHSHAHGYSNELPSIQDHQSPSSSSSLFRDDTDYNYKSNYDTFCTSPILTPSSSSKSKLNSNSNTVSYEQKRCHEQQKQKQQQKKRQQQQQQQLQHDKCHNQHHSQQQQSNPKMNHKNNPHSATKTCSKRILSAFQQIPAVALIAMFHLMIGIPFGVSYFPIGWKEQSQFYASSSSSSLSSSSSFHNATYHDSDMNDEMNMINGPFPIQGKNSLGIRMFLFSTIIGQIMFTFHSGFKNPIGLQMVENVPFCQMLAATVITFI
jgi:hypothetical protein